MKEKILELVRTNNGIITTSQVEKAGISRVYIKTLVDEGLLLRYKQGVYMDANKKEDEYYAFQVRHPNVIFSYDTALYLQGIIKEKPKVMDVTVYTGYNTHRFTGDVKCHYVRKELLETDVVEVKTKEGNIVRCYSPARTICDFIKTDRKIDDEDTIIKNLNSYIRSEQYNETKLIECANKMNCYKKLNYTIGVSFLTNKISINEKGVSI